MFNKSVIIIPARLESVRLPSKMLLDETGKPLIIHTWTSARLASNYSNNILDVFIATDDKFLRDMCEKYGAKVLFTGDCNCGTERVFSCMTQLRELVGGEVNIINLQGDYPLVDPTSLGLIANQLYWSEQFIYTLYYLVESEEKYSDPKYVKVTTNNRNEVLYFSRSVIPYQSPKLKIHVGVYGFSFSDAESLSGYYKNGAVSVQGGENLEQLMWLERKYPMICFETTPTVGIDTREDYDTFKRTINAN